MKRQLLWTPFLFLFFGITSFANIKTLIDCRGIDEIIIGADKDMDYIGKIYFCSSILKRQPIAIMTDIDGDGKMTENDTIAYYFSKNFIFFKKGLAGLIERFEEGLDNYYMDTNKSSAYYEIKIGRLIELIDEKGANANSNNNICIKKDLLDAQEILNESDESYNNSEVEDLYRKGFYDPETNLYFKRARYYDPENGRFLSPDPIGFASGDPNPYRYVENNPTNYVDPTGLDAARIRIVTEENKPHSLLIVDNPKGGVAVIDFGPTENYSFTGTVPGAVEIRNYPKDTIQSIANRLGESGSIEIIKTTAHQDMQIIERAMQARRSSIPYNPFSIFGGENCFDITSNICGKVCQ